MLRIGITGGIGSGKSTAARIFNVLGIPVYDADAGAKRLMNEDEALKSSIMAAFGAEAYREGLLDTSWMAAQVFTDPRKTALLNAMVHPATISDAESWMQKQHAPYVLKEAALIFESGSDKQLDHVIGISAPYALRMQRAMERSGLTEQQVQQRMERQMDEEEKMRRCDFIIINDEQHMLIPQVLALHEKLVKAGAA